MDSKLYPPRAKHRQKRKRSSQDATDNAHNDDDDAAPVSDIELDSILENSMAALASEDEQDVRPCHTLAKLHIQSYPAACTVRLCDIVQTGKTYDHYNSIISTQYLPTQVHIANVVIVGSVTVIIATAKSAFPMLLASLFTV